MSRLISPIAVGILCTALAAATAGLGGCQGRQRGADDAGTTAKREPLPGMQIAFFRITDGQRRWVELAISVDRNKTFRMPVFFKKDGRVVELGDRHAELLLEEWIKDRAEEIAVFGTIGMDFGQPMPAITIDVAPPGGRK